MSFPARRVAAPPRRMQALLASLLTAVLAPALQASAASLVIDVRPVSSAEPTSFLPAGSDVLVEFWLALEPHEPVLGIQIEGTFGSDVDTAGATIFPVPRVPSGGSAPWTLISGIADREDGGVLMVHAADRWDATVAGTEETFGIYGVDTRGGTALPLGSMQMTLGAEPGPLTFEIQNWICSFNGGSCATSRSIGDFVETGVYVGGLRALPGTLLVLDAGSTSDPDRPASVVWINPVTGEQIPFSSGERLEAGPDRAPVALVHDSVRDWIAVLDRTGRIVAIDPISGEQVLVSRLDTAAAPRALSLEPAGTYLVLDASGAVLRHDPDTGESEVRGSGDLLANADVRDITWQPPDHALITTAVGSEPGQPGRVVRLDLSSGAQEILAEEPDRGFGGAALRGSALLTVLEPGGEAAEVDLETGDVTVLARPPGLSVAIAADPRAGSLVLGGCVDADACAEPPAVHRERGGELALLSAGVELTTPVDLEVVSLGECGDGIVHGDEDCDRGEHNGQGCCSGQCRWIDSDGDAVCDREDLCPQIADPDQPNEDYDAFGDACDLCPGVFNGNNDDTDRDGIPDACDADDDGDGVPDELDRCPRTFDTGSPDVDLDGDGRSDACDTDDDGDRVPDLDDLCPRVADRQQLDLDADGLGDACDPDIDGDGLANGDDLCPLYTDPSNVCAIDTDGDGVLDHLDTCPQVPNPGQEDLDRDGFGDVCDGDRDGDEIADLGDNCPLVPNPDQLDTDRDRSGDACDPFPDPDSDGDGYPDNIDTCPGLASPRLNDTDGDGLGDPCDADLDGDGVPNEQDICLYVHDPGQEDDDQDGWGDACQCLRSGRLAYLQTDLFLPDERSLYCWPYGYTVMPLAFAGFAKTDLPVILESDGTLTTLMDPASEVTASDMAGDCAFVTLRDADGDGITDACDPDDDADGVPDLEDLCPRAHDPEQRDANLDGTGDACDLESDTDGDGMSDAEDHCPLYATADNRDRDANGIGDACECGDQTGDGRVDLLDLLGINGVIHGQTAAGTLCDATGDALCDIADVSAVADRIFGADPRCTRYPAPTPEPVP